MPDCVRYDLTLTEPGAEKVATTITQATQNLSVTTRISVETERKLRLRVSGDGFAIPAWKTIVENSIDTPIKSRSLSVSPGSTPIPTRE